jgi:adenine-specific DNA-methyltransferase
LGQAKPERSCRVAQQHELISLYCKNKEAFAEASYFSRKKENANVMLNRVAVLVKSKGEVNDEVRAIYRQWLKEHKNELSGGELAYNLIDENGDIYRPVSMAAPDKPETRSHRPLIHRSHKNHALFRQRGGVSQKNQWMCS